MDIVLVRQQWDEGSRRVESVRGDADRYERLHEQIEVVTGELLRRVGQSFTLDDLARVYSGSDDWAREVLYDAAPEGAPPPEAATVADAAFHRYARGAADYAP